MRTLRWLGAWLLLAAGCRWVVSLDQLSDGEAATGVGGGGGGGAGGKSGGAAGVGMRDASSETETEDGDGSAQPTDAPPEVLPPKTPLLVLTTLTPPTGIAANAASIYWVEARGIFRAPKQGDGGGVEQVENTRTAFDVGVDSDFIYWTDDNGHNVWRKPITDLSATSVRYYSPGSQRTRYLAVGDLGDVFVTDPSSVNSRAFGIIYSMQTQVSGIAVYHSALYWGYGGASHGIRWGSIDGIMRPPIEFLYMDLQGTVGGIATDGVDMYWIEDNRAIRRNPLFTAAGINTVCTDPSVNVDAGAGTDSDVAVDEQWVYFTEPSLNQISKCLK